jgi:hypothetical protein
MVWSDSVMRVVESLALVASVAVAAPASAAAQWLESKSPHYTVFYEAGSDNDVTFTRTWLDRVEEVMKSKYGVTPEHYHMAIYLLPEPSGDITVSQSGQNQCCRRVSASMRTGTIRLLAPFAPIWRDATLVSSLGLPKSGEDYHAKVLMAEYIPIAHYEVQDARPAGGWEYYSAPDWFVQGLQEYDAIFHTTEANRTTTSKRLLEWARRNAAKFSCCSPGLGIADPYNGGATFMAFLAAEFGEEVHARILRNPAATFDAAFAAETRPYSTAELFERFKRWMETAQ